MDVIGRTVSVFQEIIRDRRSADKVVFPIELGLNKGGAPAETGDTCVCQDYIGNAANSRTVPSGVDRVIFEEFLGTQTGAAAEKRIDDGAGQG